MDLIVRGMSQVEARSVIDTIQRGIDNTTNCHIGSSLIRSIFSTGTPIIVGREPDGRVTYSLSFSVVRRF
jgi:hypothetical protein